MSALAFALPPELEADRPPAQRDGVRLMVASEHAITDAHFFDLPAQLRPGDLLVINTSATLPAALPGMREDGEAVRVHVSTHVPGHGPSWRVIELRTPDGAHPVTPRRGERIDLPGGTLWLTQPYTEGRLMVAHTDGLDAAMARHGEPIRYGYAAQPWPLAEYQTVYATDPGSAEMPSAGRPFTPELFTRLAARGIGVAPIRLHCGVSSPERHETPFPEEFSVSAATARTVEATRRDGGRVIAVGTTVVRALETAAGSGGHVRPSSGWTDLVISPERPVRTVDGLITGWHEPEASHLMMLEAIAGRDLLERSYEHALAERYLWHEFGDSHLILP